MRESREIARHAIASLGLDPSDATIHHSISRIDADYGDYSIEVIKLEDSPSSGIRTFLTVGVSKFDNHFLAPDGRKVRVEFIATAASKWQVVDLGLGDCAFNIASGDYRAEPETVFPNVFSGYGQDVSTPHAWLTSPVVLHGRHQTIDKLEDESEVITWLQVIPVTDSEFEYARANGVDAMAHAFFEAQPDFYDLLRKPFVQ
ncbi:suppressor of fused domain protein [Pseudarthrobacter sp. J47]|uniref:suppressor of fused domain protein n=1 Tax=Pseudarthrobacter sp. J47 TaxID=3116482 RepID=UPI002E80ED27|nr:suppressor of fused domain protein [Pseudarthrobacter sp. J47]MEE2524326.1 suppressor of fused domain protein [Pseudarthrobacter sp. J47]